MSGVCGTDNNHPDWDVVTGNRMPERVITVTEDSFQRIMDGIQSCQLENLPCDSLIKAVERYLEERHTHTGKTKFGNNGSMG